jgi:hypothetical protein
MQSFFSSKKTRKTMRHNRHKLINFFHLEDLRLSDTRPGCRTGPCSMVPRAKFFWPRFRTIQACPRDLLAG